MRTGPIRVLKNWCFWTGVLEKTLESPLDCKEIKPVNPKGNEPWIFIGRTDAEAEAPIVWPPDAKSWLTGKDPNAGKDWRQEERGTTEDEMVGWQHQLSGHEFEQLWEMVKDREAWCAAVHGMQRVGHDWVTEKQQQPSVEKHCTSPSLRFREFSLLRIYYLSPSSTKVLRLPRVTKVFLREKHLPVNWPLISVPIQPTPLKTSTIPTHLAVQSLCLMDCQICQQVIPCKSNTKWNYKAYKKCRLLWKLTWNWQQGSGRLVYNWRGEK